MPPRFPVQNFEMDIHEKSFPWTNCGGHPNLQF